MSVTIHAKGTSVNSFFIGKDGLLIDQDSIAPPSGNNLTVSLEQGNEFIVSAGSGPATISPEPGEDLYVVVSETNALVIDNGLTGPSTITANTGQDLVITVDNGNVIRFETGDTGPGLISCNDGRDLEIDPSAEGGGDLILVGSAWPNDLGSFGQVLTTDGDGILSWTDVDVSVDAGDLTGDTLAQNVNSAYINTIYQNNTPLSLYDEANAILVLNSNANSGTGPSDAGIRMQDAGITRWSTGKNLSNQYTISRHDSSGVLLEDSFLIDENGDAALNQSLYISGDVTVSNITSAGEALLGTGGNNVTLGGSSGNLYVGNDPSATGNIYIGSGMVSSNGGSTPLIFGINGTEYMRLDDAGNFGIGLTNPSSYGRFTVSSSTGNTISLNGTGAISQLAFFEDGTGRFYLRSRNGVDGLEFVDGDATTVHATFDENGDFTVVGEITASSFNSTSTKRVKEKIQDLGQSYLEKFSMLMPREYDRTDAKAHEFGFIAEEMALVYPEIVGRDNTGQPSGIDYSKLSTILTAKVQEQQKTINELKEQVATILELIKGR
jgi:hypothetical protein